MRNIFNKFFNTFNAYFWLRFGLGVMFFYSGYTTVAEPMIRSDLFQGLPRALDVILNVVPLEVWFRLLGILELVIAVLFLAWFLPKKTVFWAGLVAIVDVALLLTVFGLSYDTMPYVGILGGVIATTLFYKKKYNS
ncbi:MAG: hypothetical protein WDZ73_01015 [Candidatus Paceibacterota bacterium]